MYRNAVIRTGSNSGIPGNQNVHRAQTTLWWLGGSGSCQGWATTTLAVSPQAADAPNCHPSEPPGRHVQGSKRRTLQVSQLDHPKQRQEKWKTSPRNREKKASPGLNKATPSALNCPSWQADAEELLELERTDPELPIPGARFGRLGPDLALSGGRPRWRSCAGHRPLGFPKPPCSP